MFFFYHLVFFVTWQMLDVSLLNLVTHSASMSAIAELASKVLQPETSAEPSEGL